MQRSLIIFAILAVLSGCQSIGSTALQSPQSDAAEQTQTTDETDTPPAKQFAEGQLYDLLVGELAGARGHYSMALQKYAEQAFNSRDPLIVERATRIANYSNQAALRMKLALLWSELEPDNTTARRLSALALAANGQLSEAFPHALFSLLQGDNEPLMSVAVMAEKADSKTRQALLKLYPTADPSLAKNYWLLITKAMLFNHERQLAEAMTITQQALKINPDAESANLLIAQLHFQQGKKDHAIELLKNSNANYPDSQRLRIQYIRYLIDTDLVSAKLVLEQLVKGNPDDIQLAYTAANTNLQLGLTDDARRGFLRLIQHPASSLQAYFQLGTLEYQQGNLEQASLYFRQVQTGNLMIPAAARLSQILAELDQLPAAQLHLQNLRRENHTKAATLFQIESEMLIEQHRNNDAFSLLNTALETFPQDISLLYARSLVGEKIRNFGQAEADLRTIIGLDESNAMALNALGYTLTLHTNRYQEAHQLILKALTIEPGDPAALDSLGWVLFHLGRHDEAIVQLEKAMKKLPDPEIAAHLGEVYWVTGNRTKAQTVFNKILAEEPENTLIIETLDRLQQAPATNQLQQ